MKSDRAKHNLIPPSKFGVIEITRQRVRPETEIKTAEVCPTCSGSGEITASILFAEEIENNFLSVTSEFPYGYSLNQGRLLYYYGKHIAYNFTSSIHENKINLTLTNDQSEAQ